MANKKNSQILDNYEIGDSIGKGRFAEVFRAVKRDLGQEVALKILLPDWYENSTVRGQFMDQAKLIARLRHPRIVEALDLGEENGRLYMAMEYLPLGDLHQWLQSLGKKRPSLLQVVTLVDDVATALDFIHSQKRQVEPLVHGDVKPGNILLTEERESPGRLRAKLSDLGLLTVLQKAVTLSGSSTFPQSSPLYISPEQANDLPPTPFSDQYALGVVTYELLTGQTPFAGGSDVTVYRQHKQTHPQPPSALVPDLPREIDEVLLKTLAKDPSGRYPNCASFARALRQAVEIAEQKRFADLLEKARRALADGEPEKALLALESAREIKPDDTEVKALFEQAQKTALAARSYQEASDLLDSAHAEAKKLRTEAPDYPDPQKLLTQFAPRPPAWWQILLEHWKRALGAAVVFLLLVLVGIKIQGRPWLAMAVQTPVFQTMVGNYWTASPTLTPTNTFTPTPTNTFTPTPTFTPTFTPSPRPFATDNASQVILLHRLNDLEKAGFVRSVAFSPKGDLFAAGSDDGMVRIWRVDDWQLVKQLNVGSKVNSISFSVRDDLLAVGSDDGFVRVWRVNDWNREPIESQRARSVYTVSFSADDYLAIGEIDAVIILKINGNDFSVIKTLEVDGYVVKVVFSPNGKKLGLISNKVTSNLLSSKAYLFETDSWTVHNLSYHGVSYPLTTIYVTDIQFFSNDLLLGLVTYLTQGSYPMVYSLTKWEIENSTPVSNFDSGGASLIYVSGNLAVYGDQKTIKINSVDNNTALGLLTGHADVITSIISSPDGQWLASGSKNEVFIWGVPRWDTTGTPTLVPTSTSTSTSTPTSTAVVTITSVPTGTP